MAGAVIAADARGRRGKTFRWTGREPLLWSSRSTARVFGRRADVAARGYRKGGDVLGVRGAPWRRVADEGFIRRVPAETWEAPSGAGPRRAAATVDAPPGRSDA